MIAFVSGAVLALFLAGVDARAIRFKTLEVHRNDGVFPPSVSIQSPNQGTGTANSIVFPTGPAQSGSEPTFDSLQKKDAPPAFKTLTVGMFDGIFPSPYTQQPGSGIVIDPSYPTGHVFPVATGSQLESAASPSAASPTLMPLTSSDALPGFFVSLPYYTVTITQTVTYAGMTITSLPPSLTNNSTSTQDSSSISAMITTPTISPIDPSGFSGGTAPNHESVLGPPPNLQAPSEAPNVATPAMQTFGPGIESALGIAPLNIAPTEIPTSVLLSVQTQVPSVGGPGAITPILPTSGALIPPYSNSTANLPSSQPTVTVSNSPAGAVPPSPIGTPVFSTIESAIASTITSSYTVPISTVTIGEGFAPAMATPPAFSPGEGSPPGSAQSGAFHPGNTQSGTVQSGVSQQVPTQPLNQPNVEIPPVGQPSSIHPSTSQSGMTQSDETQVEVISPEIIYPQGVQDEVVYPEAIRPEYAHRAYMHLPAAKMAFAHPNSMPPKVVHVGIAPARVAQAEGSHLEISHAEAGHVAVAHTKLPQPDYAHDRVVQGGLTW